MNIGIVTFHRGNNYGAVLQAFALQTFLKNAGHSPYFVDHHYGSMANGIRRYLNRSPQATIALWKDIRRGNCFSEFRRRHLVLSEKAYVCEQDLDENPPVADAYICGSDQIWNPNFLSQHKDEVAHFLDFGGHDVRRIAYAASLGVTSLSPDWSLRIAQHLKRFDSVSVREKNAVPMIAALGRPDVVCAPDPTLLLSADVYEKNLRLVECEPDVVFSYSLNQMVPECVTRTREGVCKHLGLPFVETYERNLFRLLIGGMTDPCRWLSLLKSSRFVVTNSFHATVFSIIFKRPFIVPRTEGQHSGMNSRLESLLAQVGLEDRFVSSCSQKQIVELCANPINWGFVEGRIKECAAIGAAFLAKALSSKNRKQAQKTLRLNSSCGNLTS
jgi:hypothetical protein